MPNKLQIFGQPTDSEINTILETGYNWGGIAKAAEVGAVLGAFVVDPVMAYAIIGSLTSGQILKIVCKRIQINKG